MDKHLSPKNAARGYGLCLICGTEIDPNEKGTYLGCAGKQVSV